MRHVHLRYLTNHLSLPPQAWGSVDQRPHLTRGESSHPHNREEELTRNFDRSRESVTQEKRTTQTADATRG